MDIGALGGGFNSFIEGAAALFVIFWLLASLSSFILEMFSSIFNIRGNALRLFTIDMVQGELDKFDGKKALGFITSRIPHTGVKSWISGKVDLNDKSVGTFSRNLIDHPLMRSLEQPKLNRGESNTAPAYVPSTIFAKTTLDLLRNVKSFADIVTTEGLSKLLADAERKNPHLAGQLSKLTEPIIKALGEPKITPNMNGYDAVVAAATKVFGLTATDQIVADINAAITLANAAAAAATPAIALPFPSSATDDQKARIVADQWLGGPTGPLAAVQAPLPATVAGVVTALGHSDVPDALRKALRPLIDAANHDMDKLSNEIALWYDASMQRATGWYKRYTMFLLGVIGFAFAVMFNVDTPRIVPALIANPALRQSGYAAASQVVNSSEAERQAMPQQLAYARAFDGLCGREGPLRAISADEIDCNNKKMNRDNVGEKIYAELLPLTLQSGASAQIIIILQMFKAEHSRNGAAEKNLIQRIRSFCEENKSCGEDLKSAVKADSGKGLADVTAALTNDSKLFWFPDVANAVLGNASKSGSHKEWEGAKLKSGRIAAEVANGVLSNYTRSVPGIGWIANVSEKEKWAELFPNLEFLKIEFAPLSLEPLNLNPLGLENELASCRDYWPNVGAVPPFLARLFGWILTAFMVCLGAPFWFDLLGQLVNRRGTGKKPEEASASPAV